MTNGSRLTDAELERLGIVRFRDQFGKNIYRIPCTICGEPVTSRTFSTEKVYKCTLCKNDIVARRKAKEKAAKEEADRALAEDIGIDYEHLRRFQKGTAKLGPEYLDDIEKARTVIERFDSIPEVIACVELLHIGARVIAHQKVGDFTVDFCLPDEKTVVEVDGSLYHSDEDKTWMRDYALKHMLGDGWVIRHIPADSVVKNHKAFGAGMRKMLNKRREDMGIKRL